uniref:phosphatidate phosphatase n=1 Tax=Pygocentrus nattereri TaxID=42514 RepID=A0AAR2M1X5_PYGNA
MNYVGQLAETVFVTVKELYRGLNPATLTGGIDVIVVRQPDGSLQCSPFHVRFGKLGVLRSKEKVVDIEINGDPIDLHMKLGDNGEAFFVEENENLEAAVPAHLCTSPIPTEIPEISEVAESPSSTTLFSSNRRKKRRRRRARSDAHLHEDGSSSSEERETPEQDILNEESLSPLLARLEQSVSHPHSDGECSPNESVFFSRPSSPKSDSELLVKPQETSGPQMQWNWGGFPKVCQAEQPRTPSSPSIPSDHSYFRTIQRQASFDTEPCLETETVTVVRPEPWTFVTEPCPSDNLPSVSHSTPNNTSGTSSPTHQISPLMLPLVETLQPVDCSDQLPVSGLGRQDTNDAMTNYTANPVSTCNTDSDDRIANPGNSANTTSYANAVGLSSITHTISTNVNTNAVVSDCPGSKRSQHLGPADIYLDDLSNLDPEMVALYFPRRVSPQSGQQSPQSLGSGNVDSGTDYLSDATTDSLDVTMSLCGTEGHSRQINKEKFMAHIVKYQDLVSNPGIIDDPNLVFCINSNYYNWAVAAPMILSMQAFQKNLPKSTVEQLIKDKMPKKSGRWWFSWRRRDMNSNQVQLLKRESKLKLSHFSCENEIFTVLYCIFVCRDHSGQLSSDDDGTDSIRQKTIAETMTTAQCLSQMYRKSLRLTSQQIRLNLREGANKIVFSVTTQYQGTCRCEAAIYLWNWDDKVIISDIDGTITKSDALGHILPQFGKDWTHQGIAKLYHKIHQNGYKFLYCSARAIGMADITKGYLQWVNDKGIVLPKGPVLLAPSSLFSALHREVIEKKPEVFKITCLADIRDLFSPQRYPFYAAFGNRINDVFAYKKVGVPETRIFTVNPKGELIQENSKGYKSSYSHLSELVEHVFPLLCKGRPTSFDYPEYSHFSYWREPLPELDFSSI